jgi:glucose/mannose-6-phosphate isomerase
MLDDLKLIHERDQQDALGVTEKQWQQLAQEYDIQWQPEADLSNIVHSGMGGSALWAILSTSWPAYRVPFEVIRGYDIPAYVGEQTLFIASSYSGNTEETLSSLEQAIAKGAQIVIMTSGGKLAEIAGQAGYPLIMLPKIDKPRYGALYGLKGLVTLCERAGVLARPDAVQEMVASADFLKQEIAAWAPTIATEKNQAKQLALEMIGKAPVMYAGPLLSPAAHKWKISFNENAKNVAWEYPFPEFNHNEFTGWTDRPESKPYAVVYLQSSFDNDRIKKRFDLSDKLLSGRWPSPIRVEAHGETPLQQLLWSVALGDFVSLYTALLNNVSPIDIGDKDIIERFKKELNA